MEILVAYTTAELPLVPLFKSDSGVLPHPHKNISENNDFTIRFEDSGIVHLDCEGDLFDLVEIGDFCDTFSLKLIINNRTIVENHMEDNTRIRTRYLFTTHGIQQKEEED